MACLSSLAPMVMAVVGGVLLPSSSQAWSGPSRDLSPAGPAMIPILVACFCPGLLPDPWTQLRCRQ